MSNCEHEEIEDVRCHECGVYHGRFCKHCREECTPDWLASKVQECDCAEAIEQEQKSNQPRPARQAGQPDKEIDMKPGDYLVSSNDLWRVYNDGQGNRLQCVLENVSGVNPHSQHGRCLAEAGLVGTGKRVVAVGNRNGVTAHTFGTSRPAVLHEVMPGAMGRIP